MQERTSLEDALSGIGKVERELEDNIGQCQGHIVVLVKIQDSDKISLTPMPF